MRIHRIKLTSYRGTEEREIAFAPGVTVVEGPNEVGKSCLAEAVDIVFQFQDSSQAKRVKDIFPIHRDVSPEIEIEFETGPHHAVYRKRYGRGARTELEIKRPKPANLTGRPAHDAAEQILNETLDVDLWKALQIEQGVGIDQAQLADSDALAKALDAASAGMTVEEEDTALFERVEDEYQRYFTPTGREKSELTDARQQMEEVRRRVSVLTDKEHALQADIEESARVSTRQRALAEGTPALEAEAQRREDAWRGVAAIKGEVEKAEGELERARLATSAAEKASEDRQELVTRLAEARTRLAGLEEQGQDEASSIEASRGALETAKSTLAETRSSLDAIDRLLKLRIGDFEFRRSELDATQLHERFERVTELRRRKREAAQILEHNPLTDGALAELREADYAVRQARARLEEGGPQLEVRALRPSRIEIDGEPVELAQGSVTSRSITNRTTVRLPDQLEVGVIPGTSTEQLEEALETATRAQEALRERYGVPSLEEALSAHDARKQAGRDLDEVASRIRDDLRDLSAEQLEAKRDGCRLKVAQYAAKRVPEPPLPDDLDQAKDLRHHAQTEHEKASVEWQRAEAALEQTRDHHESLTQTLARLQGQIETEAAQVHALAAQLEASREIGADEVLVSVAEDARRREGELAARLQDLRARLAEQNPEQAEALHEGTKAALASARDEYYALELDLTSVKGRLEAQQEAGLFEELERERSRLEHAENAQLNLARRAEAAKLLYETLRRHRESARRAYVAPLTSRIERLGRIVFDPSFAVTLGDDLRIQSRTLGGVTIPFESLSKGTQEQLGLLARLAVAMTVSAEGGVPLILDDALGHSDPQRIVSMAATIGSAANDCQVIIFTCSPDRFRGIVGAQIERLYDG